MSNGPKIAFRKSKDPFSLTSLILLLLTFKAMVVYFLLSPLLVGYFKVISFIKTFIVTDMSEAD